MTPENWNVLFLSTPSARRATGRCCSPSHSAGISIHALREEGDSPNQVATILKINFYPRPPRGGRLQLAEPASPGVEISIHALREEGDSNPPVWVELISGFLSTPSARRATGSSAISAPQLRNFYPRPLRGGRLVSATSGEQTRSISIHALCEEGDGVSHVRGADQINFYPRPLRGGRRRSLLSAARAKRFLSTPSARRATRHYFFSRKAADISIHALCEEGDRQFHRGREGRQRISIHALCEEGDSSSTSDRAAARNFYPRPLRGGRPNLNDGEIYEMEFLSTPSARRATFLLASRSRPLAFLSTPSARRATDAIERRLPGLEISIHALCEEGDPTR